MEVRLLVAALTIAGVTLLAVAWRRPPRRLGGSSLASIGVREPSIVQFTSPTCAPCRAAAPHLRETAEQAGISFRQVDVIERPDVARAFGVRRVPTIAVTGRRGEVVGVWTSPNGDIATAAARVSPRR